jgi:hypothetical protein
MKPNMVFAKSALSQLKAAYNLFAKVSDTAKTRKILVSVRMLFVRSVVNVPHSLFWPN